MVSMKPYNKFMMQSSINVYKSDEGKVMKQPTNLEVFATMLLGAFIGITLALVYVYRTGGF